MVAWCCIVVMTVIIAGDSTNDQCQTEPTFQQIDRDANVLIKNLKPNQPTVVDKPS